MKQKDRHFKEVPLSVNAGSCFS